MKTYSHATYLFCAILLTTACQNFGRNVSGVLFPGNPDSYQRQNESSRITLTYALTRDEVQRLRPRPQQRTTELIAPAAAGEKVLAWAIGRIAAELRKEAKRYEASYSAYAVSDIFYQGWSIGDPINLQNITFTRTVGSGRQAMQLTLDARPTLDQTAFQLIPSTLRVDLAKAKLHDWRPYLPWSWYTPGKGLFNNFFGHDNDVDLVLQIAITAVWVDADGLGHAEKVVGGEIKVDGLTLHTDVSDHNFPGFSAVLFPTIPRSYLGGDIVGPGNFVVTILAREYDNYGERIEELAQQVEERGQGLLQRIGQ